MAKTTIYELLSKTFYGEYNLRKYGGAVCLYFTDLNLSNLNDETIKQLASVVIAYLFETEKTPTFMERFEIRVHARHILKKLLHVPWYYSLFWHKSFSFNQWLAKHNWTVEHMKPHTLLGLNTKPEFWYTHIDLWYVTLKNKTHTYLDLKDLEAIDNIIPQEIPFEITSFGI